MMHLVISCALIFMVAVTMTMVGKGGGNFYVVILAIAGLPMHQAATTGQLILFSASVAAMIVFQKNKAVSWPLAFLVGSNRCGGTGRRLLLPSLQRLYPEAHFCRHAGRSRRRHADAGIGKETHGKSTTFRDVGFELRGGSVLDQSLDCRAGHPAHRIRLRHGRCLRRLLPCALNGGGLRGIHA